MLCRAQCHAQQRRDFGIVEALGKLAKHLLFTGREAPRMLRRMRRMDSGTLVAMWEVDFQSLLVRESSRPCGGHPSLDAVGDLERLRQHFGRTLAWA